MPHHSIKIETYRCVPVPEKKNNQKEVLLTLFGFHNFDGGGNILSGTQITDKRRLETD